ncbi:MAG TPA: insulinase family protein [Methylomirabilota bacterium]|nr:insulinase family protein [Methylomirabilota bacterium]
MSRRVRVALKAGVWLACLVPLGALFYRFWTDDLTANPISYVTNELGQTTLRLLLLSLALTPLRILFGWGWQMTFRRLLGLFAFFYVCLHLSVWIVLDHFFDWREMGTDIAKRPYITVGMLAFTLLTPLAATSTTGMIKRLGAARWRALHRLVYGAAVAGCLHFIWLAKKVRVDPWVYAAILAVLLGIRAWDTARKVARRRGDLVGSSRMKSTADSSRLGALALAALLLAGCAAAATPRSAPGAADAAAPTRSVLPNGVVLITQERRASDVVALQLWVRVGARDEAPAELGLSHYLEHMLFKGTPTRPPGSIDALLEGLGGTSNAFTSYDFTHYDVVVPVAGARAALEMLADIAVNAAFVPKELEAEKKVVFEEMSLTEDDPERFLTRRLTEVAYTPHPYGRPILGTREQIGALKRDTLNVYYRKHYVPANMALVVVGALTAAEARSIAMATVGRLTGPAPARRAAAAVPALTGRRGADVPRAEQQAYLGLAWHAAPTGNTDIYAVDLLTYILGDGPSSRLNQVLREQKGLVATIESSYIPRQQSGIVAVTARLEAKNLDAAEAAVLDVVRRVREQGVTEAERERAIITAEASYAFDIETAEGLAKNYGQAETTWTLQDEVEYLARLRKVTAEQIRAAARAYLADDNYVRVRFLPEAGK